MTSDIDRGREAHHVEFPSKEWGSAILRFAFVRRVVLEEFALGLEGNADLLVCVNIPLPSVHHGNIAQSQRNDPPSQNVNNVSSGIPILKCQVTGNVARGGLRT